MYVIILNLVSQKFNLVSLTESRRKEDLSGVALRFPFLRIL